MTTFYELGDELNLKEAIELETACYNPKREIKAILTGDYRNPREGDWYLSGSIPTAYKAVRDISVPYHILKIVKTKTKKITITEIA